ncbi:MAG: hypothetical protein FWE67_10675 [Planctomycetaceae bacterium]|nr:hypothetical protein [Planctomycetaceae bacterium]
MGKNILNQAVQVKQTYWQAFAPCFLGVRLRKNSSSQGLLFGGLWFAGRQAGALAILLILLLPFRSFSSEADFRFADGLLNRQMFESLEYFCNAEIKNRSSLTDKYAFAATLVRSRTVKMLLSDSEKRQNILDGLAVLETDLLRSHSGTVQPADELAALLFQLQLGITYSALGEEQFRETELLPMNERTANIETARRTLQTAIEKLRQSGAQTQLLRNRTSQNADLNFSSKVDAAILSFTYQLGSAEIALAKTFAPPDSELLQRSIAALYPMANLQSDSPVVFQCKIKLAQCYRLLNEKEKYTELLGQLNSTKNSGVLEFQTELLRYYIFTDSIGDILSVVMKGRADSAAFPEYDLVRIEILLRYSKPDETPEEKTQRQETVLEIADSLERNAGSYWGRRARSCISEFVSIPNAKEQSNPAMLAALAEEQFHQKRYGDASRLFEQAERAAHLNGDVDAAFKYGSSAMGILNSELENAGDEKKEADKRKVLIEKLRAFALRHFAVKDAAEYHLKAIDFAAKEVEARRMPLDDYITLLKEHTATWAASPKTPPLLLRTAVLLAGQNQMAEALTVMGKIPNQHDEFMRQLTEEQRQRVDGERARQAAKAGKTQEAVNILTELLKKNSDNIDNWILLASILSEDKNSLEKALAIWLRIEPRIKNGTENWWLVREKIIEVLVKLGRKDEALRSFRLLETLHPMTAEKKERLKKMLE